MLRMHEYDDRDYPSLPKSPLPDIPGQPTSSEHEEALPDKYLADRLMAVLAVLRRHEISVDAAAKLAGLSREQMIQLLRKLSIPFEQ